MAHYILLVVFIKILQPSTAEHCMLFFILTAELRTKAWLIWNAYFSKSKDATLK